MAISQNIIYTLSVILINMSLTGIESDLNLPTFLLIFTILKHMWLTTFSDEYNPPRNIVQIMVSKALMFHENSELLPSGDFYDLSLG